MSAEQDDVAAQVDLERRRVPLERKISLKFKEFRGFITEYSENLSLGGMYIRTSSPKPAGTIFDFELSLTDDFKLVQGIGEVVWVREPDAESGLGGMGVRFLDLSAESRKLIQRIVDEHVRHGGTPFELDAPTFPPPATRPGPAAPAPAGGAAPLFHATAAPMTAPPPVPRPTGAPPQTPAAPMDPTLAPAPVAEPLWVVPPPAAHPYASPPPAPAGPRLPASWSPPHLGGERPPVFAPHVFAPPVPPAASAPPAPAIDELASFQLEDDELAAMLRPETGPLLPSVDDLTVPGVEVVPPPLPRIPAGFDEVARALAGERDADLASALEREETVRLDRSLLPPIPPGVPTFGAATRAEPARPQIPDRPRSYTPRPPPRRRSAAPAIAALVIVVLLAGGLAVLYMAFPDLLPPWAPRFGTAPAPSRVAAGGEDGVEADTPRTETAPATTVATADGSPAAAAPRPSPPVPAPTSRATAQPGATARPAPTPDPRVIAARQAAAAAASPPLPRFTTIDEIWGQRRSGGTVVTLVANGAVPESVLSHFRLEGDNPREVVRVRGVSTGFAKSVVNVGTPEVRQVRTGFHSRPEGNELHVVIDLGSPQVRLVQATSHDNRVELLLLAQ